MNKEILKSDILIQCNNVQCGAKLAAEIHYMLKDNNSILDVLIIDKILEHFPELKSLISYHPDKEYAKKGHKSIYIYKYDEVNKLIDEIDDIKDKDSVLYHFACGKLFGYNDYEVMQFIKKHNR